MSTPTLIYRFILANVLTVCYSILALASLAVIFIMNIFQSAPKSKLRLEPPSPLSDPKYGVHQYIKVNNIKLHYVESGDKSKPLMVFLHGFPEFWYSWRHQILEFNKNYWCVAVDMRGYGDTERPEDVSSYKLEILVEDVRDLVRQLGREKMILIAHDWGGALACRYHDVYPETLDALVLLGTASMEALQTLMWTDTQQMKMSWYIFFFRAPVLPEKFIQANLDKMLATMQVKGTDTVTELDLECYRYWFGKQNALTMPINYYRANFMYSIPKKRPCQRKVPMMLAYGSGELYLSKKLQDRMKDEYEHLETMIVEGGNHFLQQEVPDAVNKIVKDFFVKNNI